MTGLIAKTKTFLATKFYLLYYLYRQLGNKLWLILFLNCLSVLFDGVGIAMFIPLLQMAGSGDGAQVKGGMMAEVSEIMEELGIPLELSSVIVLIVFLFTAKALFAFTTQYYQNVVMNDFVHAMRLRNNAALRTLSYKAFLTKSYGEFHKSYSEEPYEVQEAAILYFDTIKNIAVVLLYFALSAFLDVRFTAIVVLSGLVVFLIYSQINNHIKKASLRMVPLRQQHASLTSENIYNFKYLKASGSLPFFLAKMERFDEGIYRELFKMFRLNILSAVIREPVLIYLVCLLIVVQIRVFGETMGASIVVLLLFYRTMSYLMAVQGSWTGFLKMIGSVEQMIGFERYLAQNREPSLGTVKPPSVDTLQLNDVSVSFGAKKVLDQISLTIDEKKTIALVGESGGGKSTLVNLLCGLYLPDAGQYLINGVDINDTDRGSFQQKVGYISQDPTIFVGTVFENITLWQPRTPEVLQKFWAAVEKSNLTEFITALPDREEAQLGHNGINLSGGQKQRISIARELFKDIDLLIMDEATSALDARTENEIQRSIEHIRGEMIIVVIAHRLATIRAADTVLLMEEGRLAASGTFEQLREKSPVFRRMAQLQGL